MLKLVLLIGLAAMTAQAWAETIPSQDAIQGVIRRNPLVIAVNATPAGPGAQTLTIYEDGRPTLTTQVSTGIPTSQNRESVVTRPGFFRPTRIFNQYRSMQFDEMLMNVVFFDAGKAFHAASPRQLRRLGTRASMGCVRTTPQVAALIQRKVMEAGRGSAEGQYRLLIQRWNRPNGGADHQILDNTIRVNPLGPQGLRYINRWVDSWDAVIIIYRDQESSHTRRR